MAEGQLDLVNRQFRGPVGELGLDILVLEWVDWGDEIVGGAGKTVGKPNLHEVAGVRVSDRGLELGPSMLLAEILLGMSWSTEPMSASCRAGF